VSYTLIPFHFGDVHLGPAQFNELNKLNSALYVEKNSVMYFYAYI